MRAELQALRLVCCGVYLIYLPKVENVEIQPIPEGKRVESFLACIIDDMMHPLKKAW